jgi:hypothetical protein
MTPIIFVHVDFLVADVFTLYPELNSLGATVSHSVIDGNGFIDFTDAELATPPVGSYITDPTLYNTDIVGGIWNGASWVGSDPSIYQASFLPKIEEIVPAVGLPDLKIV